MSLKKELLASMGSKFFIFLKIFFITFQKNLAILIALKDWHYHVLCHELYAFLFFQIMQSVPFVICCLMKNEKKTGNTKKAKKAKKDVDIPTSLIDEPSGFIASDAIACVRIILHFSFLF